LQEHFCSWPAPRDNSRGGDRIYRSALFQKARREAELEIVIVIILLILLFGSFPTYPYSRNWGYYPSGAFGTILLIVVILWLLGVI
jgi:hypothetical protein